MEKYEKRIKRTNIFFLVLVILYIGSSETMQYFMRDTMVTRAVIVEIFLFVLGIIFLVCWKVNIKDYIRLKNVGFVSLVFSVIYAVCIIPIMIIINAGSMLLVENKMSTAISNLVDRGFFISFLTIAVVPAIVEEFLFRGIIYRGYRQARPIRGVFYSALLFGALHMNFNQFCYTFFLGIALALIAEVTDSLIPGMIVHCVFNGQSVLRTYLLNLLTNMEGKLNEIKSIGAINGRGIGRQNFEFLASEVSSRNLTGREFLTVIRVYLPFAIGGAVLAVILLIALAKRNHRYAYIKTLFSKEYKEERSRLPKPRIVDVFFILSVLICFVMCIYYE